jgi:arsenate reductase
MEKLKVLFLCEHNSARSQMAEGLLRHLFGDTYEVFSAGMRPTPVHPLAIQVMAELGIDISHQTSKHLAVFRHRPIDMVVSVCQLQPTLTCSLCASPMVKGRPAIVAERLPRAKHYLHHGFKDPSGADGNDEDRLRAFRRVRDDIQQWLRAKFADPKAVGLA